jgi:peptidoglycan/xylan/chitin deacetylase (PgdA/CDA1 family)
MISWSAALACELELSLLKIAVELFICTMIGKTHLKRMLRTIVATQWKRKNRNYLIILNYHQVTPTFVPGVHAIGTWTPLSQFENELEYIISHFNVLGLPEAFDRLRRGDLCGAGAAITLDDGDASVERYSAPLLRKHGVPATFFINTAALEGHGHYWFTILNYLSNVTHPAVRPVLSEELTRKAKMLRATNDPVLYDCMRKEIERLSDRVNLPRYQSVSAEWLASLDGGLFTIGAHGHEHQRFAMMSHEWQRGNLQRNINILSQFRAYRPFFAIPFGRAHDFDTGTLMIAAENQLSVLGADGGINIHYGPLTRRIPADSRSVREAVAREMAGW